LDFFGIILGQIGGWIKSWKVEKSSINEIPATWIGWMFQWLVVFVIDIK
jgi:hypothetical protein